MKKQNIKVIVTGGGGLLASNLAILKRDNWDIHLFINRKDVKLANVKVHKVDLEQTDELYKIIESIGPNVIIHTAGLVNVDKCEENRHRAYIDNVIITKNICQVAQKLGVKFVHISTDHFSNPEGPFSSEDDISLPVNQYSQSKLEAECEVLKTDPSSLIIRTNFFGWGHNYRKSISDYIIDNLRDNKTIKLFSDVFFTPILIDNLVEYIETLIDKNLSGIFNVIGNERVSKYQFGVRLAKIFNLDDRLIEESSIKERKDLVRRPTDMSLSNEKLYKYCPENSLTLEDYFIKLKELEIQGRSQALKKSVIKQGPDFIGYGRQTIRDQDIDAVVSTLTGDYLTQGPSVKKFEDKVTQYVESKYAVAVNNLTSGLHLACLACGIGPGDIVITSPVSFMASANCAIYCGATPVFADIDPDTLCMDPDSLRRQCEKYKKIKAIIPVHLAGYPCNMEKINQVAQDYGAIVIEDAAQALGGEYISKNKIGHPKNSKVCGFSLHPVKNLTTGEGGVLTTNDKEIYNQLLRLRSHGINKGDDPFIINEQAYTNGDLNLWYHEMQQLGFNYRITDFQCALGISQLNRLDQFIERRREIAKIYDKKFEGFSGIKIPQREYRNLSGNHLYILRAQFDRFSFSKAKFFKDFRAKGIGVQVHHIPIYLQPYYRENYDYNACDFPNAQKYYEEGFSIPFYPDLTKENIDYVSDMIIDYFSSGHIK